MHRVPLARAIEITRWAEEHWGRFAGVRPRPTVPYETYVGTPWRFRLINGRYVQLWHDRRRRGAMKEHYLGPSSDGFYDVVGHAWVTDCDFDSHLPELCWNMSMLAGVLAAEPPPARQPHRGRTSAGRAAR